MHGKPSVVEEAYFRNSVIKQAFVYREFSLYGHVRSLIKRHGEYTTIPGLMVFTRTQRSSPVQISLSDRLLDSSLSAAQDAINTPQPVGPSKQDLQLFKRLWDVTIKTMEQVLEEGDLDLEVRAWGIIGLAAGYRDSLKTPTDTMERFTAYKDRLRAALKCLTSLASPHTGHLSGVSPDQRAYLLVKARRELHICSNLLLQHFKDEGWANVRWYHGVAVAERWVRNLELKQTKTGNKEVQEVFDDAI